MFTKEDSILRRIERRDWVASEAQVNNTELDAELMTTIRLENRPGTGSKDQDIMSVPLSGFGEDGRPLTIAITKPVLPIVHKQRPRMATGGIMGTKIRIEILATWGDAYYTGLTGIEV
jgi:hypothetical protein